MTTGPMVDASVVHRAALDMSAQYLQLYREQCRMDQENGTDYATSIKLVAIAYQDMARGITQLVQQMIR